MQFGPKKASAFEIGKPSTGEYAKYLRAAGFQINEPPTAKMSVMKQKYGTDQAASCHTIVLEGYAIEGHVPAAAITKLLKEKPNAKGIAVVLIGKDGSVKP